jgi:hypothetical protein
MKNYDKLIPKLLSNHDVIMQKPIVCFSTIKAGFVTANHIKDYEIMKDVVHDLYPKYDADFLYILEGREYSNCCIFIAKWDFLEKYFEWIFSILFEAEKRIDTSNYTPFQKRIFAFIAERLFSVYVRHNKLNPYYATYYYIDKGVNEFYESVKRIVRGLFPRKSAKILEWMENIVHPLN